MEQQIPVIFSYEMLHKMFIDVEKLKAATEEAKNSSENIMMRILDAVTSTTNEVN